MAHAKKKLEGPWVTLRQAHKEVKRTRHRGDPVASALATQVYLRRLEEELDRVRELLLRARRDERIDRMDEAQQRLHGAINRGVRREREKAK
jgi:hypothetical protein